MTSLTLKSSTSHVEPETGRRYTLGDLTNPNHDRPNLTYEFLGVNQGVALDS